MGSGNFADTRLVVIFSSEIQEARPRPILDYLDKQRSIRFSICTLRDWGGEGGWGQI